VAPYEQEIKNPQPLIGWGVLWPEANRPFTTEQFGLANQFLIKDKSQISQKAKKRGGLKQKITP
jgi:hypothetical protein